MHNLILLFFALFFTLGLYLVLAAVLPGDQGSLKYCQKK